MEDKDLKTENVADNDNETQNVEVTVDENKDVKADIEKENKVEEKPLTDDELYTKIQTEKLLKKKKVKKITFISLMSVLFALVVVIICLASIPVDLKPEFLKASQYNANVIIDGKSFSGNISPNNDEKYKEFNNVLNDAFARTYFAGIFDGSLMQYDFSERRMTFEDFNTSLSNEENNDYVYFELLQPQTLKNRDGSNYSSRVDSTAYPFEFTEVYMMLSSEEGNDEAVFYVVVKYVNNKTEDVNELTEYVIKLTTRGNTFAIYDHYNPQED